MDEVGFLGFLGILGFLGLLAVVLVFGLVPLGAYPSAAWLLQEEEQRREKQAKGRQGRNWWDVLDTAREATRDEVKAAYRQKIKLYHPDRVASLAPEFVQLAEQRSRELNAALDQALRELAGTRS